MSRLRCCGALLQGLVTIVLLLFTAVAAFAAGFATSVWMDSRTPLQPRSTPVFSLASPTPSSETNTEQETFQLFWEVWHLVEQNYYGQLPDEQTVTYGAIRGMLETLGDDYTSFIEPQAAAIIEEDASGTFEGIGAFVRMRDDGRLEISGVISGQPAEQAGLRAGDVVLAVDGQSIAGYGIYEAIALIRGPAGSQVTLLIERSEDEETRAFEVTVTRARVEIPLVEARMLEDNVAYIHLTEFSSTASDQMRRELEGLLAQNPVGLIFDLRGNPGGWLEQAVEVSDLFLDNGVVLIQRSNDGGEQVYRSRDGDLAESVPLVVLINGGSASASEIVAGAVQARGRGILIGEQSFGKGSVQQPFRLSDGSELRVTVARWYTPADVAIHGQGLTPDIVVPWPEETAAGEDPQIERARQYLLSGE
jgi:carboxyl-terminal processing protease